ncbi:MAG: MerR family transcriptional regulator [Halioglobus sp.]
MTGYIAEQRPLYGIGTVARLAHIKPDTLRVWERRYGLGASRKSDTGRRLYTQTDLEHLQIVSRLVKRGFRIGEIAAMERKTLTAMMELGRGASTAPNATTSAVFLGSALCDWLDRHPGCLAGLDSSLHRTNLADVTVGPQLDFIDKPRLLVLEAPALGAEQVEKIIELYELSGAANGLVFYEFSNQKNLSRLVDAGLGVDQLPIETEKFAKGIRRMVNSLEVGRGIADTGELTAPQPRLFRDEKLADVMDLPSMLSCGCSHHLSELIQSLVNFEQYSSQCSAEDWQDAATHTCVHAYTNQARWLMEKALAAVLAEHEDKAKTAKP